MARSIIQTPNLYPPRQYFYEPMDQRGYGIFDHNIDEITRCRRIALNILYGGAYKYAILNLTLRTFSCVVIIVIVFVHV